MLPTLRDLRAMPASDTASNAEANAEANAEECDEM
jgi:hypothetical protein